MTLTELCFHLRKRRRMYLLDDRFATAVAFVEGFNTALDGAPLAGFQDYVADRILGRRSSLHWSYIVGSLEFPSLLEGELGIDQIPIGSGPEVTELLVDLLEDFQARGAASGG
ncbi:hypothetical protein [Actinoplanes regularis]|uniref:Uncharacterized protein n=1 Tax=Actinoplanes regularis TaxID=52697 RepID=A0A238V159_9ACTN|nr:hypothetical protein [Actinoplanes regularis]GIE84070.1 hypothetical protein Are01nite_05500 [Actinoplanes regularis]SNR28200.1 hypothetical protein SAMN06264365_101518 [Actinoplanes regularis]